MGQRWFKLRTGKIYINVYGPCRPYQTYNTKRPQWVSKLHAHCFWMYFDNLYDDTQISLVADSGVARNSPLTFSWINNDTVYINIERFIYSI